MDATRDGFNLKNQITIAYPRSENVILIYDLSLGSYSDSLGTCFRLMTRKFWNILCLICSVGLGELPV